MNISSRQFSALEVLCFGMLFFNGLFLLSYVFIQSTHILLYSSFGFAMIISLYPWWKRRNSRDVLEPAKLFMAFFAVSVPLKALLNTFFDSHFLASFSRNTDYFRLLTVRIFLFAILGTVFLYLGYYSPAGKRLSELVPKFSATAWKKSAVVACIVLCLLFGLTGLWLYIRALGGLRVILSSQSYLAVEGTAGKYFYIPIIYFILTGFSVFYLSRVDKKWNHEARLLFALYSLLIFSVFFIRSSKGWLFRAIFYILVARNYMKRPLKPVALVLILLLYFSVAPVFMTSYRVFSLSFSDTLDYFRSLSTPGDYVQYFFGRFYGADVLGIILERVQSVEDYQFGSTLLSIFYWFIPRGLWPEKPLGYGIEFGRQFVADSPLSGASFIAPSFIGELYLNLGPLGVALGFFVAGVVLRTAYDYFVVSGISRNSVLLYSVVLFNLVLLVEGPIAGHLSLLLGEIFPFVVVLLMLKPAQQRT